jgi:hypothetical protein
MQVEAMACGACGVRIEGSFVESVLNKLSEEDQDFLEQYRTLGYAAIRSRLDRLIRNYQSIKDMDSQKRAVLEQLRTGEISVEDAKRKLEQISGGP